MRPWDSFFVVVGTSAGALIGLLFVALSLHLRVFTEARHADLRLSASAILTIYFTALFLATLGLAPFDERTLGFVLVGTVVVLAVFSFFLWRRLFRAGATAFSLRELRIQIARQSIGMIVGLGAAAGLER